ncbi:MAG: hypothetical protein WCH32_04890 [Pseudomonadota bacterium]
MNTRPALYRSTLVAAALAAGCLGLSSLAAAHDHDGHDRERGGERYASRAPHGWRDRDEHRRWAYARPAPVWRPAYRDYDYDRDAYRRDYLAYRRLPAYGYYPPPPPPEVLYGDGDVSVMIHVPL